MLSVTVSPAAGTPGTGSDQVQFVATGRYNTEPFTVTPLQANWGVCNSPQRVVSVTADGLALWAPPEPSMLKPGL